MGKLEDGIKQLDYIRSEMINEYMITSGEKYKELIEALADERKCDKTWKN